MITLGKKSVLFLDGTTKRLEVFVCTGPCMVGEPTAFVKVNGTSTWVKPGESVDFVEA